MNKNQLNVQVLAVSGMHCANCGILIDETVEELADVESCATDVRRSRCTVTLDPSRTNPQAVIAAITAAGYQAALQTENGQSSGRRFWKRASRG